ncbi:MAG: hypothetical protein DCF15_14650 [Phormidesmis priestleyi]|uniref:EAL domain-containing protein n=1 Tax=Phormidesmis priestleyi TaxID=268141 RepID=A0A2W4X408_9CYAN|nr:MAG: hypothetical protein DCF15_14650 [Phormidesmis priestleyi]
MLCIDDFEIGYSSLSRLQQIPIDMLKIDRSFVQHIGPRRKRQSISYPLIKTADKNGTGKNNFPVPFCC